MSRYKVILTLTVILFCLHLLGKKYLTPLLDGGVGLCAACTSFRNAAVTKVYAYLPSPHAEFLLGTTLGIDRLNLTPRFNDVLKTTGTIHVVVVSGYNISLVINRLLNLIRNTNSLVKVITAQVFAAIYALITGFEPPVVRALFMASVILWARYKGKKLHMPLVLAATAAFMVLINPSYLVSLSFQLSFLATAGIVLIYPKIESYFKGILGNNMFVEDFCASVSAQVLVMPLLYLKLDVLNFQSVIINTFTLWLIPLLTLFGFTVVVAMFIHPLTAIFMSIIYYYLSNIFIQLVEFSASFWI